MVLPAEATAPADATGTSASRKPQKSKFQGDQRDAKPRAEAGQSAPAEQDDQSKQLPVNSTGSPPEEIPGAAEDEAPAEPSAPDRSPSATLRQENAAAGSGDTAGVPALAQPGRGSENLAQEDRIQLSKNGLKNGNSPPSSLSLHPTSSDSDEELAMGQRMQQLPRSPSADNGNTDSDTPDMSPATNASAPLSTVITPTSHPGAASMQPGDPEDTLDGAAKTCSLCGNTKALRDFGPKKGARDGKDCYCRVCSTLRRRYSIPVVRAAVENGTIHQLMGQSKSKVVQNADPAQLSNVRPPRPPVTAPARPLHAAISPPQPPATGGGGAAAGTVCVMCGESRPAEVIAMMVGGDAFCSTCDRMRRRANNLGLSTRKVVELYLAGDLAGMLGEDADQPGLEASPPPPPTSAGGATATAVEPQAHPGAAAAIARELSRTAEPLPPGVKPPMGRICRMCRQVRAPVIGFQRLSYCADCEIIKGRAQTRGFSVAQLQDSFEASTVPALFGDLFSFMVGGTRFDGGAGGAAPGFPAPREAAAPPQLGCEGQPPGAATPGVDVKPRMPPLAASGGDSGSGGPDDDHGRGKRKRKLVDISDMVDGENIELTDGEWRDGDAERGPEPLPGAAAAGVQPPHKMAQNGVLLRRCALCRAIRPLDDFPLDGKRSHGRACYCRPCKRLRGRAAAVSRSYDVAWLRSALEAGELRQRLGAMAESVLVPSVPHKPVTTELSAHATLDWPPPAPGGGPAASSVVARGSLPPQRSPLTHMRSPGGSARGGAVIPMGMKALAGPLPALAAEPPLSRLPPLAPPAAQPPPPPAAPQAMWLAAEEPAAPAAAARGDGEGASGATAITRSILAEHREFARMYLAVRERMLVPELSPAQLDVEQQTAAELEAHLHMLRDLIRTAFLG